MCVSECVRGVVVSPSLDAHRVRRRWIFQIFPHSTKSKPPPNPARTALQTRSTAGVVAAWRPRRVADASAGSRRSARAEVALYMAREELVGWLIGGLFRECVEAPEVG